MRNIDYGAGARKAAATANSAIDEYNKHSGDAAVWNTVSQVGEGASLAMFSGNPIGFAFGAIGALVALIGNIGGGYAQKHIAELQATANQSIKRYNAEAQVANQHILDYQQNYSPLESALGGSVVDSDTFDTGNTKEDIV